MKKTIFKGTINGKEFTTVQDYNQEIMKLQAEGKSFNASSNTQVVDVVDECEDKCNCTCKGECGDNCTCKGECGDNCTCKGEIPVELLPGFADPSKSYMDFERCIEEWELLEAHAKARTDKMSLCELNKYAEKIETIIDKLRADMEVNENAAKSLDNKIEALNEQIAKLTFERDKNQEKKDAIENAGINISNHGEFYQNIMDHVVDRLDKLDPMPTGCKEEQVKTNMTETESQKVVDPANLVNKIFESENFQKIFNSKSFANSFANWLDEMNNVLK